MRDGGKSTGGSAACSRSSPFPRAEVAAVSPVQVWKMKSRLNGQPLQPLPAGTASAQRVLVPAGGYFLNHAVIPPLSSGHRLSQPHLLSAPWFSCSSTSVSGSLAQGDVAGAQAFSLCLLSARSSKPVTAQVDGSWMILGWSPGAHSASTWSQASCGSGDALTSGAEILRRAQAACVMLLRCLRGLPCGSK